MSRIPVIAVDGPSGSGKGVVTSHLAEHYGFHILDSGALYRLVGIAARNDGLALENVDFDQSRACLLYTSPSPRDQRGSRMPSSA